MSDAFDIPQAASPETLSKINKLRIAVFSGNYNCVRDGANQALNRLVAFLERHGADVRVYSPTVDTPAFEPAGTLISVPSVPIPRRSEYRLARRLPRGMRKDLAAFRPNIIQISAPDFLGCSAVKFAETHAIPCVASVHTRFDTYFRYYGLGMFEGLARWYLQWLYNRCQQVYVPSGCMADILKEEGVTTDIRFWGRGIEHDLYKPARRDMDWRRGLGIRDDEVAITFVGRIVMEKGLAPFADAIRILAERGVAMRPLIVGDGPARGWFESRLPGAVFTGSLFGEDLARAYASADIFFNPSTTETFGNVNLEAMASGLPVVGARASGSNSLIADGVNGLLVEAGNASAFADALERLVENAALRSTFGAAGHARSLRYNWDDILGAVAGHYLDAIAGFEPARAERSALAARLALPEENPGGLK